jgi:hypothetical protein
MKMHFLPGTLVRLVQPELFNDEDMYLVIGLGKETIGGPTCKILKCRTGEIFEWYEDVLTEIK